MTRYASIWFPYLLPEHTARKNPEYRDVPFVLSTPVRGRMLVKAANEKAVRLGIRADMVLADCKAIHPDVQVVEAEPGKEDTLLRALAEWCIGYTPSVALDLPDGLLLDSTGCAHLWGGEERYVEAIRSKLAGYGYHVRIAIADTIGAAWAMARFGKASIVKAGNQKEVLRKLPATALRLEPQVLDRLKKLGLETVGSFIDMPHTALRRRFGESLPFRIRQALGQELEFFSPIQPIEPYRETLPCLEPICTATGIGIALERLLESLCVRLQKEGVGLRSAVFSGYRIDGDIQRISVGTGRPSRHIGHLMKLFELKVDTMQPDLGFEMFVLEAPKVEDITAEQEAMWDTDFRNEAKVSELLDRVAARTAPGSIRRYIPAARHWPEHSVQEASVSEKASMPWRHDLPRPIHLLLRPERIGVSVQLPDYPPMLFRYKGTLHEVAKADGPERIEQEWWLQDGLFRDYYVVEDQSGARFWLFRSGPYDHKEQPEWFLHGFFA